MAVLVYQLCRIYMGLWPPTALFASSAEILNSSGSCRVVSSEDEIRSVMKEAFKKSTDNTATALSVLFSVNHVHQDRQETFKVLSCRGSVSTLGVRNSGIVDTRHRKDQSVCPPFSGHPDCQSVHLNGPWKISRKMICQGHVEHEDCRYHYRTLPRCIFYTYSDINSASESIE